MHVDVSLERVTRFSHSYIFMLFSNYLITNEVYFHVLLKEYKNEIKWNFLFVI